MDTSAKVQTSIRQPSFALYDPLYASLQSTVCFASLRDIGIIDEHIQEETETPYFRTVAD